MLTPFETSYNLETKKCDDVKKRYIILRAVAVDDYGEPVAERITGFAMIPEADHDWLASYEAAGVWLMTPEQFTDLDAHEWLRRVALHKASSWSQPTREQVNINIHNKRMRR